ncbi:nucleotidyltransferase domain-containing protein [Microbacterium sp. 2FI]|uniref:nucleotidyltransferase domain-containing protein n=1 Tax=Microbacterium sp. 2FI TaxID=2502193 RepID=UPI001BB10980|nr:nucleotidyltransferase domain-containing protein [Microbacterium sp. 2FI]
MFTPDSRSHLRDSLIALARVDIDVVGAALVGSAARGTEDDWSDIDLVLQLAPDAEEVAVVDRFTRWMDTEAGTADTLDVVAGGVRYRVFLLSSSLQVDISFWPHDQFRATTDEGFQLIFGSANPPTLPPAPQMNETVGMGWLYALHARSALARGKLWQAVTMLDDLRNQILTLACARYDLNPWHGREIDRLPADELAALAQARPAQVTNEAIEVSLRVSIELLLDEIARHDPARASRLLDPLSSLTSNER